MKFMIEKVLIQVEDRPGYVICDAKNDLYCYFGWSGLQTCREGIDE